MGISVWDQYVGISVWVTVCGFQCVGTNMWTSMCEFQWVGINIWVSVSGFSVWVPVCLQIFVLTLLLIIFPHMQLFFSHRRSVALNEEVSS